MQLASKWRPIIEAFQLPRSIKVEHAHIRTLKGPWHLDVLLAEQKSPHLAFSSVFCKVHPAYMKHVTPAGESLEVTVHPAVRTGRRQTSVHFTVMLMWVGQKLRCQEAEVTQKKCITPVKLLHLWKRASALRSCEMGYPSFHITSFSCSIGIISPSNVYRLYR